MGATGGSMLQIADQFRPLLGEVAWYSVILDPRIASESDRHYDLVRGLLQRFSCVPPQRLRILEVASYAHTTGYRLARELGAQVTLFEISRHSLRLGRSLAGGAAEDDNPRLVAGDFHALPFEASSFDLVYICSALHHSLNYPTVLRELMRVLAPAGLLFLENEPTERRLCFHKFRCNRPDGFTPFERRLQELDLLRTMGEPYVGSRPEELFGMIENQTMPLAHLFEILDESCELEMLELSPEQCMGGRERGWLRDRAREPEIAARNLLADLEAGCREAEKWYSAADRGMGYALPGREEMEALAAGLGPELAGLPEDPTCPEYRYRISRLFGAPVRLVARKRGAVESPAPRAGNLEAIPRHEGIYEAYPAAMRDLLAQPSRLPDLQQCGEAASRPWFPTEHWNFTRGENQIVSLTNRTTRPVVNLPRVSDEEALTVLRIYCAVTPGSYFRLAIRCGREELFAHGAYIPETVLFAAPIPIRTLAAGDWRLDLELTPLPERATEAPMTVAVSYAGFFPLTADRTPAAAICLAEK
jgi:SAM-dependent methyltransferase